MWSSIQRLRDADFDQTKDVLLQGSAMPVTHHTKQQGRHTLATAQALPQHNGIESLWWMQMQFRPCSAKGCSRSGHIHFEDIEPRGRRCRKKMFSVFLTCSNTEEHRHERTINVAMCNRAFHHLWGRPTFTMTGTLSSNSDEDILPRLHTRFSQ